MKEKRVRSETRNEAGERMMVKVLIRRVLRRIVNYKQTVPGTGLAIKTGNARWFLWTPSPSSSRRRLVHYELQSPVCDVQRVVNSSDSSCRSSRKIVVRWQRQPRTPAGILFASQLFPRCAANRCFVFVKEPVLRREL